MSGLQGISAPVYVALVNWNWGNIFMAPRNFELMTISPSEVDGSGVATYHRKLDARAPGGFVITATLLSGMVAANKPVPTGAEIPG